MSDNAPKTSTATLPFSELNYERGIHVSTATPRQVVIADVPQGLPEGSVLATATDKQGQPTTKLDPKETRVVVNGIGMRLGSAIEEGFVRQNADGTYTDVPVTEFNSRLEVAQKAAEAEAEARGPSIDAQAQSDLSAISRGLGEMGLEVTHVIAEMLGSRKWPDALNALARNWDVPIDEMQARVGHVFDSVRSSIDAKLLVPHSIDPTHFREWLATHAPKHKHNAAFLHLVGLGDWAGYQSLVTDYTRSPAYSTYVRELAEKD